MSVDFDDTRTELDANRVWTIGHELSEIRDFHLNPSGISTDLLLSELMQQTTFANTHITDDDILENVGVIVRALARHGTVDCLSREREYRIKRQGVVSE